MSLTLTFLSISRILVAASCLFAPTWTANAASYPHHPNTSSIPYRLWGSRELVLGSSLWFANSRSRSAELLPAVLLVGAVVDAIDIVATGACVLQEGNLSPWAVGITAGGAALAIGIQVVAYSGLRGRRGGKGL